MKPKSRCRYPQCPVKLDKPGKCQEHQSLYEKERRGKEPWRNYGNKWQQIRKEVLDANPRCIACGGEATEVDHIKRLKDGGNHDKTNLQSMCKSCHSKKTYSETLKDSNK